MNIFGNMLVNHLLSKIRLILENYSQDDIENDKLIEIALKKKAIDEINRLNDCFTIYGKLQEA